MAAFKPHRQIYRYCQINLAPPERVFPLLCPVRETDWLDGWHHHMLYSESGVIEKGCVFSTPHNEEEDTTWVVTHYDPRAYEITFARFTPGSRVCVLEIAVAPHGDQRSHVHIAYTYTALAPAGNQFIDAYSEADFLTSIRFWEKSINHYLTRGEKLKRIDWDQDR